MNNRTDMGRLSGGERGVSELYGTLLVIGLTIVVGIFLIGTGTFVVQQLTSDSESSVGTDTMYEINQQIDSVASGSAEQFSDVSLPDVDGEYKITERDTFRINITPRSDYANRTNETEPQNFSLGAIVYESPDGSVLSYQAGGLWEQGPDGEFTQLRSDPYLEFTGDRIRFGFVDVTDANIRGGSELSVSRSADGGSAVAAGLAQYVDNQTRDKHNPTINVPANITLEITSAYADGWARYAREKLSADPVEVSMSPDNSTVTIDFGKVGEAVWDGDEPEGPPFEATDSYGIVYSGLSDYAYKYDNDSDTNVTITHDEEPWGSFNVTGNGNGSVSELSKKYELALVAPVESVDAGSDAHRFNITPPSDANLSATPVCVIETPESEDGLSILDELDEQGEGCFDPMVGIDSTEVNVGAINYAHQFNVTIEDEHINSSKTYTPSEPIELDINVTNKGDESGQMPLGVYFIPDDDWPDDLPENTLPSNLDRTILASGNTSGELSLDANETTIKNHSPGVTRAMAALAPTEWTAFVTTGRVVDNVSRSFTVGQKPANVSVDAVSVDETAPVEGEQVNVTVALNETEASEEISRVLDLQAQGPNSTVQIDQREVSIAAGANETIGVDWTVPSRFAGQSVDINASVSLTTLSRNVTGTNETQVSVSALNPEFNLKFDDTDYEVPTGEAPQFNVTVENTGTDRGEAVIELADLGGDTVDQVSVALDPGNTEQVTLELPPRIEDADGTVDVDGSFITPRTGGTINTDKANLTIGSEFTIADINAPGFVSPNDDVTIDVTINNTGAEGERLVVVEAGPSGDRRVIGASEVELGDGNTTESFTWQTGSLTAADNPEVFVTTRDNNRTTSVNVASRVEIVDYEFEETDLDQDDKIETKEDKIVLQNTGDRELNPTLTLGFSETSENDTVSVTIDPNTTKTVDELDGDDLEIEDVPRTGTATLRTGDDKVSEQILVTRDGPDCANVSYEGSGTAGDPYEIENVDQLQCIDGHDEAGLDDHYVMIDDIDASGTRNWNDGDGFEPIGQQGGGQAGDAFTGTFDGQGHTIENMYIDRYDEPFVGIFAITGKFDGSGDLGKGSEIRQVKLKNISVWGMTVVGGLVGGAGGTVEQVSVDGYVESQYQQVGGIIGHGHDADANSQLVSRATVVGNSPIVINDTDEHPWQEDNVSPNLGIGGIIGGTGFDTDVSTAYSTATVKGNSSVGGIAGWTSNNPSDLRQMYWAGGNLTLEGEERVYNETERESFDENRTPGAIAGRIGESEEDEETDTIRNSVYSGRANVGDGTDNVDDNSIEISRDKMKGPQVLPTNRSDEFYEQYPGVTREDAEGTMANLNWSIWQPVYEINSSTGEIINEDFPRFAWEYDFAGEFGVEITDLPEKVTEGSTVEVEVKVTNTNSNDVTQSIRLFSDQDGNVLEDTNDTNIDGYDPAEGDGPPAKTVTFEWDVPRGTAGENRTILVKSEDDDDIVKNVSIEAPSPNFKIENITLENADNGTIAEGAQLNLTATIENTGNNSDKQVVELTYDGTTVDAETVALDPGDQNPAVNLSWQTTGVVNGTNASETVTVATDNDNQDETVTVKPQFPNLAITAPVDATDIDSQVAGTPFNTTVTLENTGSGAAISQPVRMVLESTDGSNVSYSRTVTIDSLAAGDSTTRDISTFADVSNAGEYTLRIEADDANRTISNVLVSPINLTIVETNAPVLEGQAIEITATARNPDSTPVTVDIELLVGDGSFPLDVRTDLRIDGGNTTETTFVWNTQFGDAGNRDATIKVTSIDGAARETVGIKVNEVNPVLNDATIRVPDSPIDIDLGDLQIGEDDE
ncbi:hypothetical protein BRC62_02240 [Halobacteriales archaeon QH_10_67_13]|nr:MAG: hypothetical protein BRC62_02240 [Halobacteriales archaeon QH_10_67_13]